MAVQARTKPSKKKPASRSQGAADSLRQAILAGRYRPGESLPGERELSEKLGVSRLTLRSGLAQLEAQGLVRAVHGSGTRVLDYRESGGVELLGHLAQLALSDPQVPGGLAVLTDLLELRRAVAVDALGLAAERATTDELRLMREHLGMQEKLVGDARAFMVADLSWARLVVRATHNLGFELLYNSVARTVIGNPGVELAFSANAPATIATYRRLLASMEARDVDRVRATASRLLTRLDRTTVAALGAFFAASPAPEKSRRR